MSDLTTCQSVENALTGYKTTVAVAYKGFLRDYASWTCLAGLRCVLPRTSLGIRETVFSERK